ncbi:hypothetical protein HanPSC8_Chr08g0336591 [Helianthus annuus]|nr:hypothetical protein HanPSC8_Chr08g0336591 [Helianthus annuus]
MKGKKRTSDTREIVVSILDPFSFHTFGCSMHFLIKNTMINTFIAQSIHTIVKLLDH